MILSKIAIIIVSFLPLSSSASDCKSIRLDENDKVLRKVPVLSQGETHACYAFSAAQLIDAFRFSLGASRSDFTTSPIAIGALTGDMLIGGGNIWGALNSAREHGICNHHKVDKIIKSPGYKEFLKVLTDLYNESNGISGARTITPHKIKSVTSLGKSNFSKQGPINLADISTDAGFINRARDNSYFDSLMSKVKKEKEERQQRIQKSAVEAQDFLCRKGIIIEENELIDFFNKSKNHFLKEVIFKMCKADHINIGRVLPEVRVIDGWEDTPKGPRPPSSGKKRKDILKSSILTELGKNKPIAIEFCNETVISKTHVAQFNEYGELGCESGGNHGAVIVGSKKNLLGSCSYLVRDSLCDQYSRNNDFPPCKNGQYWISEERLLNNTRSATYLDY